MPFGPLSGSSSEGPPQRRAFGGSLARNLEGFFDRRVRTPALEDPRLVQVLDRQNREIDKRFRAAMSNFERSAGQRGGGDVAAFQRDIAIARSEASSGAFTEAVNLFENLQLETASGALAFLTGQSQEELGFEQIATQREATRKQFQASVIQSGTQLASTPF